MAVVSKRNILEKLADTVRDMLEKGEPPPWKKPWIPSPVTSIALNNPVTGRAYTGSLNIFTLYLESSFRGYEDPRWVGYQQAKTEGWQVRKGETAAHIYVPIQIKTKDADGNPILDTDPKTGEVKPRLYQAFKSVPVFNAEQIDRIPPLIMEQLLESELPRSHELDTLIQALGINTVTTGNRAFYNPVTDQIGLPPRSSFLDQGGYDSTRAHELAHATGHSSRLDRPMGHRFGTTEYAFEELIAEATAYTLCRQLNLSYAGDNPDMDREQAATYIAGWNRQMDNEALTKALDKAVTATGFLQNTLDQEKEKERVTEQLISPNRNHNHITHTPNLER